MLAKLYILLNTLFHKIIKKYNIIIKALVISLIIELLLCNFPFWRTLLLGNKKSINNYIVSENSILITDINIRLTNIYFTYNNQLSDKITYTIYYTTEENSDKIQINPKIILKDDKHFINFDTHSLCKNLEIFFLTETDTNINQIFLNYPILDFDILRTFILFIIFSFFFKCKETNFLKVEYNSNNKVQNNKFIFNLVTMCIFIFLYMIYQFNSDTFFVNKNDINKEDSILMQTEAIMHKQIELLEEPSMELKEMKNPYDNIARDNQQIYYLYDVAYYNGNYYNYFGITPIITLILPFRIITGYYTHTYIFNFVYLFISIISLYFLYKNLIRRFIYKTTLLHFYLGFYAILFSSNIFTLLRGQKYDIVVSSGIMFILISINLAISIYKNEKWKNIKLISLGITMGLIVLSKPNLIVYYPIILLVLMSNVKKINKKFFIDCIYFLVPLVLLAIFQMFLNYIRFDNIFEFGARYQLTGFNMNYCMSVTIGKIFLGLIEYFFRLPTIKPLHFPFVFINTDTALTTINEVCYENRLIGLAAIPITYSWIFKNNIEKKEKDFHIFLNICLCITFISIIINTCFGGICEAYSIDFKLVFSLCSVLILLKLNEKENIFSHKFMLLLTLTSIIIMIPINLTTESNLLTNFASDITVYFKNTFEFWY